MKSERKKSAPDKKWGVSTKMAGAIKAKIMRELSPERAEHAEAFAQNTPSRSPIALCASQRSAAAENVVQKTDA